MKSNKIHPPRAILIHGMALYPWAMWRMAGNLRKKGYIVHTLAYPSTGKPIDRLMEEHLKPLIDNLPKGIERLDFVTHSLGAILVRLYHKKYVPPAPGRTVMLGPPNHGSEVADFLKRFRLYRWYFGPPGQTLGTTSDDVPPNIGPANFETGIIAGTFDRFHFPFSGLIHGPNDGLVSVESSKLEGMKDHIVMNVSHTLMIWKTGVIRQALAFLETGSFNHK